MQRLAFLLISVLLTVFAQAESTKTFGDYDVHYNVLNATFISSEVAKAYGIVRGKNRALINVAVRERLPKGQTKAVKANITGSSSDLIHSAALEFQEIVEQQAVYYIAELKFNNKELRTFTINIQADPAVAPYTLKFSKTLYFNE
ncbi:MAG: hypothetical protein ACJAYG_002318 [Oceanicoccus sp.]|jgi:hypothetical protein